MILHIPRRQFRCQLADKSTMVGETVRHYCNPDILRKEEGELTLKLFTK